MLIFTKSIFLFSLLIICSYSYSYAQIFSEKFDVSVEFTNYTTRQVVSSGVFYIGDTVSINMKLKNTDKWDKKKRFIYLIGHNSLDEVVSLFYPVENFSPSESLFPYDQVNGKSDYTLNIADVLFTYPAGNDFITIIVTSEPINNIFEIVNQASSTTGGSNIPKDELLLFLKGNPMSSFLTDLKKRGEFDFRTYLLQVKPASDKNGFSATRSNKALSNYYVKADSSDILYSPIPLNVFDWNNFPMVDFISPKFELDTRGSRLLKATDAQKMLFQGVVFGNPRRDNIKNITINNQIPSYYNPKSGLFEYQYILKDGLNVVDVSAEDSSGKKRSYRVKFNYTSEKKKIEIVSKNYLLVVGIDNYENWPILSNAVKDAKDFKGLMMDQYSYSKENIFELCNAEATREKIITNLRMLLDKVTPDDNLLIYYSGHGWYDQKLEEGYWVPVDAKSDNSASYVENVNIAKLLRKINSKKTLLISDACYAGAFIDEGKRSAAKTYNEKTKNYKARIVFASGGLEEVSDGIKGGNSPFATSLISYLKNASSNEIFSTDLIEKVKRDVADKYKQIPKTGIINDCGDEGGEFIFTKIK